MQIKNTNIKGKQRKERKKKQCVITEIRLSLSISFPSLATVEVCHLLLFPDKDGCFPLRHNGNAFTTICLCYSLKARGVLFSLPSANTTFYSDCCLSNYYFVEHCLYLTPILSQKKESDATVHPHTHTHTQSTGQLSAIFVGRLQIEVCEGSGCAHAPRVPVDKVTIQQNKEQIALSACLLTSNGVTRRNRPTTYSCSSLIRT